MVEDTRLRRLVWVLVAAALLLPAGWVVTARLTAPGDGTLTYPSIPQWSRDGVAVTEVLSGTSPLRVRDCVMAVDGVPIADLATQRRRLPAARLTPGTTLAYTVLRPDAGDHPNRCAGRQIVVPVVVRPYPLALTARAHAAGLPLLVVLWVVGSFVLLHRPRDPAARALFALSVLPALGATSWPLGIQIIDLAQDRLWPFVAGEAINTLLWGTLLHFAVLLALPSWTGARPWIVPTIYLLPFLPQAGRLIVSLPSADDPLRSLGVSAGIARPAAPLMTLLIVVVMIVGYRTRDDAVARRRLQWLVVTLLGSAALYLALFQLPSVLTGRPLLPLDWIPVVFLPFPLALGAAVLRYSVFDIDVILRRSLVYLSVTVIGVGIYLLGVLVLGVVLGRG